MGTGGGKGRTSFNAQDGVTLREYFEARLSAVEQASNLAACALEKRLGSMNEFRDTLRDQASKFVTREEVTHQLRPILAELSELKTYRDRMEGKASQQSVMVSLVIAVIGVVTGVISLVLH